MNKKDLIVYYTWSGNTGKIAGTIHQKTGGNLFEIEPVKPYSSNYSDCTRQARDEIKNGILPELEALPENIEVYERIFVGTPNWWSTMAPPLLSFLSNSNLTEKTIVPFCTHGGGGLGRIFDDIRKACPESEVKPGLVLYGDGGSRLDTEVSTWLSEL